MPNFSLLRITLSPEVGVAHLPFSPRIRMGTRGFLCLLLGRNVAFGDRFHAALGARSRSVPEATNLRFRATQPPQEHNFIKSLSPFCKSLHGFFACISVYFHYIVVTLLSVV
jgi:hypothetical protein